MAAAERPLAAPDGEAGQALGGGDAPATVGGLWSWGVLAIAAAWLAGALLAPLAAERGWAVAPLLYLLYRPICHQLPERSFELWGHQAAACHRCVGLYAGFVLGLLVMPWLRALREPLQRRPWLVVVFALPLLVDVALLRHNTTWSRFATGVLAAVPLALLAQLAARDLRRRRGAALRS